MRRWRARLQGLLGRDGADRTAIAIAIAIVSVLGAIVAWQASLTSEDASRLDQHGMQQLTMRLQRQATDEAKVDQDLRLLATYQGHVKAWRLLSADADSVRRSQPGLAASLDGQAQGELALARTLEPFFLVADPGLGDSAGMVAYDPQFVLANLERNDQQLNNLRPEADFAEGKTLHGRAVVLVGLVAVFVAGLFFFTLAQLGRARLRPLFATAGLIVALTGVMLWVTVG